ncbi:MAG TPA: sulfatase [Kofleriaceae bacterium]|nr:sulfatase [Kofleriaceae bacterium]
MRVWVTPCVLIAACGTHSGDGVRVAESAQAPAPAAAAAATATATVSGPTAPPRVKLAASPRIDLDANRARWHVTDRGLVLEVAGEGLRKYDLAYRTSWRDRSTVDGRTGRVLKGKTALAFPWIDGDAAATVIVHAVGGGKLTLSLDGKKLGTAELSSGAWGPYVMNVAPGALAQGEHVLTVDGKRAMVERIEILPTARTSDAGCGDAGWRRVSLYTELPAGAHLVAKPVAAGGGAVRVAVTAEGGARHVVHDGPAAALPAALALPDAGEQVVRLDLEADACARWDGAQIAVTERAPAARPAAVDNVVLVVVDTLRADRLKAYVETRVETPWLTAAAARGAVFLRNQSMAPSSPPSHATIHTGQIPRVHGATGDDGVIAEDAPVLAAIAGRAGMFTAFVGNNDFAMTRLRGPGGWDVFETPFYKHGKDCGPMFERGVALVGEAAAARKRFFLSLLPIEPHVAYRFHDGITDTYFGGPWSKPFGKRVTSAHLGRIKKMRMTDAQWAQVRALYDGEVTHVDRCLAALEDGLRAAGVLDRTAIVIASDHGEGLGERATNTGHAYGLNRELVDTPLVIVGGVSASRVTVPSSNADIAPTVLDLLGLPADARMQGRSLIGDTLAAPMPRVVASEYGKSYALRAARWHLVVDYSGRGELFDSAVDLDETHDRSGDAAAAIPLRYLRDAAGLYLAHRAEWKAATWGALNDLAPGNPLSKP